MFDYLIPGLAIVGAIALLGATAADAAPAGVDSFAATAIRTIAESPRNFDEVVACYGAKAVQPSFAHVARSGDTVLVQLRFDQLMFETTRFSARPGGGTRVEVALSGRYNGAERAHYAAARGAPLAACLAEQPVMLTSVESAQ
jgi:hypothetical protein